MNSNTLRGRAALIATPADAAATLARVALGAMIVPHGMQKLFGSFGGYGFAGTMEFFTGTMGFPYILGLAAIFAEFFGGVALLVGFCGRVAAALVGITMLVAALSSHLANGFFINWSGTQKGEGIEFFILAVALACIVVLRGSGAWSVDRLLTRR